MRLLYIDEHGDFCLTADPRDSIPPYGILSHRWRKPEDEVTFKDVNERTGHLRKGIDKLLFCAARANEDGLRYFWVDTCCIDKSSSLELSRSITSMFRWYQGAEHCYVYLDDIEMQPQLPVSLALLAQSKWFTRGWTLQELLAPASVKFFDGNSLFIGAREQLAPLIHQITGIDVRALTGTPAHCFTDEERFRWAANRMTTEPEDKAYSLLGLFGVTMLPHYGEGRENAFNRLKKEVIARHYQQLLKLDTERLCYPESSQATQGAAEQTTEHKPEHVDLLGLTIQGTMDQLRAEDADLIRSLPTQNTKKTLVRDAAQVRSRRDQIIETLRFDDMDARRSTITPALEHTCGWLLDHAIYQRWISEEEQTSSFLWIRGHAGAGKSTLMRFADHHISTKVEADGGLLISFYFNARGSELEHSVNGMYRSLIVQLMTGIPYVATCLDTLRFGRRGLPTVPFFANASTAVLQEIFAAAVASQVWRIYCLIDALDETSQDDVHDMVDFLARQSNLLVCFASRHYPALDLETPLKLDIDHESGHSRDITKYLENKLRIGAGPRVDAVKKDLLTKANGIFMWVVLVVTILNKEFRRGTIVLVQQRLQQVPPRLSELLREISQQGDIDNADFLLCLQWLLFAKRPLRLEEFYPAMLAGLSEMQGLTFDEREEPPDREQMKNFMLTYSKGLAELTQAVPQSLQFIHESIREYLLKHGGLQNICEESDDSIAASGHERLKNCCYRTLVGASESQMRWTWPVLLSPMNWTLSEGTDPDSEHQRKKQDMRRRRMMPKINSAANQMQHSIRDIPTAILHRHQSSTDMLHSLVSAYVPPSVSEEPVKQAVLRALEKLLYAIDDTLQDRAFEALGDATSAWPSGPMGTMGRGKSQGEYGEARLKSVRKIRRRRSRPIRHDKSMTDFFDLLENAKSTAALRKPLADLVRTMETNHGEAGSVPIDATESSAESVQDLQIGPDELVWPDVQGWLAETEEGPLVNDNGAASTLVDAQEPLTNTAKDYASILAGVRASFGKSDEDVRMIDADAADALADSQASPAKSVESIQIKHDDAASALADSLELIEKRRSETGEAFGPSLEDSLPFFEYSVTFVLHHSEEAAETVSQHGFLTQFDLQRWRQAVPFAPEMVKHNYKNLLSVLASQGYVRLVRTLLENDNSQVNARELDRRTALIIATNANHMEVIRMLIKAGADVHARDESGQKAIRYARCKEVEQLLLDVMWNS